MGVNMKKKSEIIQNVLIVLLALSIPGLLALANFETTKYAKLEKEVSELEDIQYQLIEENRKLVSEIGVLSSSERIEQIAVNEYGMRLAESEEIIRVDVKGNN
jgi:cell division protein FtsL